MQFFPGAISNPKIMASLSHNWARRRETNLCKPGAPVAHCKQNKLGLQYRIKGIYRVVLASAARLLGCMGSSMHSKFRGSDYSQEVGPYLCCLWVHILSYITNTAFPGMGCKLVGGRLPFLSARPLSPWISAPPPSLSVTSNNVSSSASQNTEHGTLWGSNRLASIPVSNWHCKFSTIKPQ